MLLGMPVALAFQDAVPQHQEVPGEQLLDGLVDRVWSGNIAKGQIGGDRVWIQRAVNLGDYSKRLNLRCESQRLAIPVVGQRLLADAIASDEQLLFSPIPNGKREHSHQPIETGGSPLPVGGEEH